MMFAELERVMDHPGEEGDFLNACLEEPVSIILK
jgi:hypothetical protein